jgi:AraC family transcriptional regulator of adaptative response/methylated-DNA-[protein]-cysteine methyltransferase
VSTTAESRWQAVEGRDTSADGTFVFGVATTGIYCRPSCPARRPKRSNTTFFESGAEAEAAGYRPCRRCDPTGADRAQARAMVEELCRHIEAGASTGEDLSLQALAERGGTSVSTLQRQFKAILGVTPKQFVDAARLATFRRQLDRGSKVTDAIYDAGFGSSSRLYERVDRHLGMTPGALRRHAADVEISWLTTTTPLGRLLIAATDRGLCFVSFGADDETLEGALEQAYPRARLVRVEPPFGGLLAEWLEALEHHLAGTRRDLDLPIDLQASAFSLRVWTFLRTIPYGSTRTYTEVAAALGAPTAARAVARACATNPVALAIPCHRVVRSDGALAGYRWGIERKQALLALEQGGSG